VDSADAALVARVLAADDRHAFAAIVRRHQAAVRGLLRKLTAGDHALADDLAQEAFLRAYRRLSTFEGRAKLSTWLCQIAYRAFLDGRSRKAPVMDADPTPPSEPQARPLLRHDVERALRCLTDDERAAIALTFGQDMTHAEAAVILGWPLGTLKSTVARGLEKLEPRMRPWRDTA
jgi:RNA polymerase sigma-70 factor, ECF subfamily